VYASSGGALTTTQAQTMLKALGPAAGSSKMSSLVVDGVWGPLSAAATQDFQTIKGITPIDGIMGPQTAATLVTTYQAFTAT
jgi:peptidoglycan hydrolase-like protein with peptidoglycan-binding domain